MAPDPEFEDILRRLARTAEEIGLPFFPFIPAPLWTYLAVKTMAEKAVEVSPELWEGWKGIWKDILLTVHDLATSPYPVSYEEAIENAANYLALSSLLGVVTSLAGLGAVLKLAAMVMK